jgi:hypothetical protein
MTEATAAAVKIIKRQEDPLEAMYFAYGEENANQIIAWVESHGNEAAYITDNKAIWSEFIRIRVTDIEGNRKSRFVLPGNWVARQGDDYERINQTRFEGQSFIIVGEGGSTDQPNAWVELAASVCHEANRELQLAGNDPSPSPHWKDAPNWQKASALEGVVNALNGQTPRELHESWMAKKLEDGWEYGETKNGTTKTHPCLVPYDELPEDQKLKDSLFSTIVKAFKDAQVLG